MPIPKYFAAVRAVFFDAVGTLIYPCPAVGDIYAQIGRRWGSRLDPAECERRFRAAFRRQEEHDQGTEYRTDEVRERQRWEAIVRDVFHDQPDPAGPFSELWEHFAGPAAWACFDDAAPALSRLRSQGLQVGIASNFDGRLRPVLTGVPALAPCTDLVLSAEVGWRKPAAQFFAALTAAVRLAPEQVLLIGDDWENDYQAASAAGLQVLLLDRKARQRGAGVIGSLGELPSALE